jgi:hypothetical protein
LASIKLITRYKNLASIKLITRYKNSAFVKLITRYKNSAYVKLITRYKISIQLMPLHLSIVQISFEILEIAPAVFQYAHLLKVV